MNNIRRKVTVIISKPFSNWWLAFLCIGVATFLSVWGGQDANWDLRNYHYYNPYAWVNGRAAIDIAPAQLQSFHSPFADLPYYYMAKAGFPSWLASAVLSLPAALALFFLTRMYRIVLPQEQQNIYLIAVVLLAATGASGGPLVGTTMSEWHLIALFICAIWFILPSFVNQNEPALAGPKLGNVIAAGFLGGLAVGLKLTAATYAIGLAVLVTMLPANFFERCKRLIALGCGGIIGAAIAYGPWGYELWIRFGNPFFPYFNNIFLSPWAEASNIADKRFIADSFWKLLTIPWLIMKETSGFVSEMSFRDWRLGLGIPALVWLVWRSPTSKTRRIWLALLLMSLTIYAVWAILFGYYRYVSLLEVISALAIVSVIANHSRLARKKRISSIWLLIVVITVMGVTKWPQWERVNHGEMAVSVKIKSPPKNSIVIIASLEPLAFIVPQLPPEVPVISVINNFMNPAWGAAYKLQESAMQRVAEHGGPFFALVNLSNKNERYYLNIRIADMLLSYGLEVDFNKCNSIAGALSNGSLGICSVNRVPVVPINWNH